MPFKKAGLELPPQDWTWEDFEKTALALHEKLGIWGIGPGMTGEQLWKSLYMGMVSGVTPTMAASLAIPTTKSLPTTCTCYSVYRRPALRLPAKKVVSLYGRRPRSRSDRYPGIGHGSLTGATRLWRFKRPPARSATLS